MKTNSTMCMSRPRWTFRTGLAILALALLGPSALAGDSAQAFIRARQDEVSGILKQPKGPQRDRKIATVLDGMMDYTILAERSLAQHWADVAEPQRKEFSDVLRRLVQRSYEKNIQSILDYEVEYLGEDGSEGPGVIVHTRATSKTARDEPVSIDYRVQQVQGGHKVVDVITEGSSLVANYRSQFHRIIQKDGFDALLRRMKDKLAKGETT